MMECNVLCPWGFLLKERTESILLFPFWRHFELAYQRLYPIINQCKNMNALIVRQMIFTHLKIPILRLVKRVLVYEFNDSRNIDEALSLPAFLEKLSTNAQLKKLLDKYPLLSKLIDKIFMHHHDYIVELLTRLQSDIKALNKTFHLKHFAWRSIHLFGDSHCLGKQVAMIEFQSKNREIKKIIYKPRDISLEKAFHAFVDFVNNHGLYHPIKTFNILSKQGYGWCDYVEQTEIDESKAHEYYHKFGILLGICHLLNGQDFHLENVIASGANPMIIDLECLFSVPVNQKQEDRPDFPSLVETLLIPTTDPDKKIQDLSALQCTAKQPMFIYQYKVKGDFANIVYIERLPLSIKPEKNRLINSQTQQPIAPANYSTAIAEGYHDLMHWVIAHRDTVISFITNHFSHLRTRIVFRPTFKYANILFESFHPVLLSDTKKYFKHMEQLSNSANKVPLTIYYHELFDLLNLDIPYFSALTTNNIVENSQGETTHWKTSHTGLERGVKRIHSINHTFIQQGINDILASLNRDRCFNSRM